MTRNKKLFIGAVVAFGLLNLASWAQQNVTISKVTANPVGLATQALSDPVNVVAADAPASSQVTISNSATLIVAANTRRGVSIQQLGTNPFYCGFTSGVTTSTGDLIVGTTGAAAFYPVNTAIYCITSSSTSTVSVVELK